MQLSEAAHAKVLRWEKLDAQKEVKDSQGVWSTVNERKGLKISSLTLSNFCFLGIVSNYQNRLRLDSMNLLRM